MEGRLPACAKLVYGLGHVFNDLCAAIWFSYLLVYLQNVVQMTSTMAGYVLLLGQVVDALATPVVGYESDRTRSCMKYGRRKSWHFAGSVCVAVSFPFLFLRGELVAHDTDTTVAAYTSQTQLFLYFAPFVILFQIGWAAVQVAHMALITDLSSCEKVRVELGTIRYAWTVIANIIVYSVTGILFGFAALSNDVNTTEGSSKGSHLITVHDAGVFARLAVIVVAVGSVFSLVFHLGTREKRHGEEPGLEDSSLTSDCDMQGLLNSSKPGKMTWRHWLCEPQFYQVCAVYTCSRLIVNVTQVYLPLYLLHSLHMSKNYIAYVPLTVYISGIVISLFLKYINTGLGRKVTLLLGLLVTLLQCLCLYGLGHVSESWVTIGVVGAAILLGLGGTTITVASMAMTADLIGEHTESSAFVYGSISFGDKLANGLMVMLIQVLYPCPSIGCCEACSSYYRGVLLWPVALLVVVGLVVLASLGTHPLGSLHSHRHGRRSIIA